jgi:glucose/arabinose dehydrogenase
MHDNARQAAHGMGTWLGVMTLVLALGPGAAAQVGDPVPGSIPLGDVAVHVEVVAELPDSGSVSRPRARPMLLTGDGSGRRFVADQNGPIYQIHGDGSLSMFLDVAAATALVANQGQKGVSSFAFHPDYFVPGAPGLGRFYTASSQPTSSGSPDYPVPAGAPTSHHSVLHEWQVDAADPEAIDPTSAREVLRIGEPYGDHNVGQIGFDPNSGPASPDHGLLYIAMGDGGNGEPCCPRAVVDPLFLGQDLSHPLGTLLRIDPLQDGGDAYRIPTSNPFADDGDPATLGEIWAYGLRNPHRFSFDRGGDGALFVSDIGQASLEEVNRVEGGGNYGWSEREGTFLLMHDNEVEVFALPLDDASYGFSYPVIQYDHDEGDRAISGGYVYRSTQVPQIAGQYVFGDLASGRVFYAPADLLDGSGPIGFAELRLIDAADHTPKSLREMVGDGVAASRADLRFGFDDAGEIYLVTKQDGRVRRIAKSPACQDGLDNDGDGRIDADGGVSMGLPPEEVTEPDPNCFAGGSPAPWKTRERARGCGLGGEAAWLLLAAAWLSRRLGRRAG